MQRLKSRLDTAERIGKLVRSKEVTQNVAQRDEEMQNIKREVNNGEDGMRRFNVYRLGILKRKEKRDDEKESVFT